MPGTYQSPGVYIEELSSNQRPVVGASVSVAAFVDVFAQGPTDVAIKLSGPGDFERALGGVCSFSEGSYAISQFFLNGGSEAWAVRVVAPGALASTWDLPAEGGGIAMTANAKNPGLWGDTLMVGVQYPGGSDSRFDLVVGAKGKVGSKDVVGVREVFRNLSATTSDPRYYLTIVKASSQLISVEDGAGGRPALVEPPSGGTSGTSGTSGSGSPATRPADLATTKDPRWFAPLGGGSDGDVTESTLDSALMANAILGKADTGSGLWALDAIAPEIFNILCLPVTTLLETPHRDLVFAAAADFCADRRAMYIIDPPRLDDGVRTSPQVSDAMLTFADEVTPHPNTACYFPSLVVPDPLGDVRTVGPSGTVAGVWARFDGASGVWNAPAGTEAQTRSARPVVVMNDAISDTFNPLGFNVIRTFPVFSNVVWGARTREGADLMASQWKYVPVRRTALFIEESLRQGLQWAVFQPNDDRLWAQLRLSVGSFMHRLFTLGAFGSSDPAVAYLVKCDSDTTSSDDASRGVVNVVVGFLPQMVSEFVVIKIQQLTRPTEV
jgi:uncharacterized protein